MKRKLFALVGLWALVPILWADVLTTSQLKTTGGGSGSSTIASGTTVLSGFVDGDILYNNGGVIGGFAIYDDTGAGNGAFALRKTMSGASATSNFFSVTGTHPATLSAETNSVLFATTIDNDAQAQNALKVTITGAGNGSALHRGLYIVSTTSSGNGNHVGIEVDVQSQAGGGTIYGIGPNAGGAVSFGAKFLGARDSGTQSYGVIANSRTGATNKVGLFASLGVAEPTSGLSGAIVADNGTVAADIFVTRDNGTAVFTIADGATPPLIHNSSGLGGSGANPLILHANNIQRHYIEDATKSVTDNTATTLFTVTLGDDRWAGGTVSFCAFATSAATDGQTTCGEINFAMVDVTAGAGGESCSAAITGTNSTAVSVGTLTVTAAGTTGTDLCNVQVTADSSLDVASLIRYQVKLNPGSSTQVVNPQ